MKSCMKEWIMCGLFDKDMFMRRNVDYRRIVKSGLSTGVFKSLRNWRGKKDSRIIAEL